MNDQKGRLESRNVTGKSSSMNILGVPGEVKLFDNSFLSVAVAVNGNKNSQYAVKWALEKFVPEGRILYKLIYVCSKITKVPTSGGNYLPIAMVQEDLLSTYKKEVERKTNAMLLPYKLMCVQRQVQTEIVIIESDDVANAITEEITKSGIDKLVIGASSRGAFTRKAKAGRLSSKISASSPSFCTIYVISKGKLLSVQMPASSIGGTTIDCRSNSSFDTRSFSSETSCPLSEWTDSTDTDSPAIRFRSQNPLALQRDRALKALNQHLQTRLDTVDVSAYSSTSTAKSCSTHHSESSSLGNGEVETDSILCCSPTEPGSESLRVENQVSSSVTSPTVGSVLDSSFSDDEVDVAFELDKLRIELRHVQGMYETARNETSDASHELKELRVRRTEESQKLQEISSREQRIRALVRTMKENREAAEKEAALTRERAEREFQARQEAEDIVALAAEENRSLKLAASDSQQRYRVFQWTDILSATSSLSSNLIIGGGGNGTVYRGSLHHTRVAVKILRSNEGHRTKQFEQELEVLGKIRHPHLLLLLGACPDRGCLVYEYMESGSLEDRLQRRNGEPPLRWFDRFRIAWEVASALVFLHNSKPKPIVHRDLKPANILLDRNLVSKIGDVGLSTLLPATNASICKETAPVGTFCYIDPEYQRTGILSPKSDVYALGVVVLQLLTAKPPMGLAHVVETAMEDGCLADVLDSTAGKWPPEETRELTLLGLRCAELRRRDRPNLQSEVLPFLERLRSFVENAQNSLYQQPPSLPPSHFICPILQEVMVEPCVAADGYTYDRRAIEIWLSMNDKSPLTNLPLPEKTLIPDHTLLSAINEWKSTGDR